MTAAIWHTRPVFITSTFRDMHAERDWLRNHVFPELEERLRQRRTHLEPIDLRWGVETVGEGEEHARELLVLKVCLAEVERSRPFLIALIGDRYGWIPPAERIAAAAQEAGFEGEVAGRSVTDLEIDYGVLSSAEQQQRCFFYLRDPLPCAHMPADIAAQYSEHFNPAPEADQAGARLTALKRRIETQLPERVRHYGAQWDADKQTVTGLAAWGQLVLDDLWRELAAETAIRAQQGEPTWQQAEAWTLEQFSEERARHFIGREATLETLLALAHSPAQEGQSWGNCVTGSAGAGKSALFAELHRRLSEQDDSLVLAHAAGISPRSTQVDALLRRWIDQLAMALAIASPIDENTSAEDVEQTFHTLLGRAATQRRVVLLIDALNQFEPTPRARHLTWLPKLWPPNARLITTAIPGEASAALRLRPGTDTLELPPLSDNEASEIARAICRRYHRDINPQVLEILRAKKRIDGQPAAGNPLWLELAIEELNLLDADDFARAERDFTGRPEQRLHQLLRTVAQELPADIEAMYGWMLDRAEQLFGQPWAQAYVNLIAVSRHGWRESDLKALMPTLSNEPWEDLKFAALRRSFRAHVVQRGAQAQWDYSHTQMRLAVAARNLPDPTIRRRLHATLADHLLSLPRADPLHESETLVHLIGADDPSRAATYYGGDLTPGELTGATRALADHLLAQAAAGLAWLAALLDHPTIDDTQRQTLCNRCQFELDEALENEAPLATRHGLLTAVRRTLERLAAQDPGNAEWQRDLSVSHDRLGDVLTAQGDLAGALNAYRAALAIAERLAAQDPGNAEWQRDLSVSHEKLGDVLTAQGDLAGALNAYRAALAIAERLAVQDPGNAAWQHDLSVSHDRLGNVLTAQGDLAGALNAYRASLAIRERLTAQDPGNAEWQRDLSVSHNKLGDVLTAQGDLAGALNAYRADLAIAERLAAQDPGNAAWQRDLSVSHNKLGDVLTAQGDLAGALNAYRASLAIRERLAVQGPGNAAWQRDRVVSFYKLASHCQQAGETAEANDYWRRCQETLRHMKSVGMFLDPPLVQLLAQLDANET